MGQYFEDRERDKWGLSRRNNCHCGKGWQVTNIYEEARRGNILRRYRAIDIYIKRYIERGMGV